ncbi:hypothetical protein SAMN05192534_109122 [Alteribacillus persepolensis]|uniref:HPP family protein n=1 Tax=Alteribacillus persepolensis TaxID=568899 RepID=A0A1G8EJH5_9BACI|nr:hypothetical protein SAMN05192534_109122 [Alteribacillus persepolensis]
MITRSEFLSYFIAILFVLMMVSVSILLNNPEVIIPEIAALAIAFWVWRISGWMDRPWMIFVSLTGTAIIGFAINQLPLFYFGKLACTLLLMLTFMWLIKSNLSPELTTGLIAVVTDATHRIFLASVSTLSVILTLGIVLFGLNKKQKEKVEIEKKHMVVFLSLLVYGR